MFAQTNRFLVLSLCVSLFVSLVLAGCCQTCTGDKCTPRSPWQSPTIQATRALVLVNQNDLRILRIDGKKTRPTCIGEGGMREYHLPPGKHVFTAVFRHDAPPGEGLLADVRGCPLTQAYDLSAGHEYVAFHREHPGPQPQGEAGVAPVATNVFNPPQLHWCLEIVDLDEPGAELEPEVREAQAYSAWIKETSETLGK